MSNSSSDANTENQQTDNRSPNKENKETPIYSIRVADFTVLVSIIANNASSTVPQKILHVIQRTIESRKAYAVFYEKEAKNDVDITLANVRSFKSERLLYYLVKGT